MKSDRRTVMKGAAAMAVSAGLNGAAWAAAGEAIVETTAGRVRGARGRGGSSFLGIP